VVKLFKRKTDKKTANFKFDGSIKLKDLPIEEYAHVAHAFQVSVLRFERMLKESLLEGYITSTTLERISQEFKISAIRELAIPEVESVALLFGSESPIFTKTQQVPTLEEKVIIPAEPAVPTPDPSPRITPEEPTVPDIAVPEPVVTEPVAKPIEVPEISAPIPKISFSIPSPASKPESSPEPPKQSQPIAPESSLKAPTIPKISFPASPSSSASPLSNPLANIRGRKEEDRATGIAILRKQMLTELKKIRSVVAEQDQ
jgi:hypothetical protein